MEQRGGFGGRGGGSALWAWIVLSCAFVVGASVGGVDRGAHELIGPSVGAAGEGLCEVHAEMVARVAGGEAWGGGGGGVACFAPGTPEEVIQAFRAAMDRASPSRYQQQGRWSASVAIGNPGAENEPITLTYSFAPDGTVIPSGVGEPIGNSDLFSFLDGVYGSTQTWQDLFHDVFDRWSELSGVTYVHEPNDDGAAFFGNAGQLGVRGDVRIGGKFIDGNASPNILGYNMYPSGGSDMVLDTADAYLTDTSANSRRLRNLASHEAGHGLGMLHVCPNLSQKLMEPRATTIFDGPQHDDIRNAQDFYGDAFEPNENALGAEDLGLIPAGVTVEPWVVPSPTVANGSLLSLNERDTTPFTNDEDWFQFSTDGRTFLTISVEPIGLVYQDNPQSCPDEPSSCCSGTTIDSLRLADLAIELRKFSGTSLLASANANGLGVGEEISDFESPTAETFQVRVYTTTQGFLQPQLYSLAITSAPPGPPGAFSLVSPTNGSQNVESGPILDWGPSLDADEYLVEVDTDINFGSPDVSEVLDDAFTGIDLPHQTLQYDTQYFWRVTASNALGSTLSTPSLSGFRTAPPPVCGCIGDIDGDCDTDVFDFAVFAGNFGQIVPPGTGGDMDGDGDVDVLDFGLFGGNFGCVD